MVRGRDCDYAQGKGARMLPEVIRYIPGTPEFDAVAKTVTHIRNVRKDPFGTVTNITEDRCNSSISKKTRRVSVDKMR